MTSPSPLVLGGAVFRSIEYSLAGALLTGTISSSANPTMISVGAEGTTTATYLATDLDENRQNAQSTTIRIDKHPPTIQASVNPLPNLAGWNNRLPVTVSFTCADNVSGVQICPSAQSATSEGRGQVLSGIASDYASNTATASATLNIDVTPPVVSFSGNLGTYTVDQTVQIACAATDNLSGVVTYGSTCPATTSNVCLPIIGPAYSFLVGTTTSNQFSFAATDLADNCASAQGSFKVTVTYNSLCNLVQRFSSQQNISDALCAKLFSARSAPNQNAKAGKMGAFQNQVNAQSGKAIPADDAGILERLGAICLDEC